MDSQGNTDALVALKQAYQSFLKRNIAQKIVWILSLILLTYFFFAVRSRSYELMVFLLGFFLDRLFATRSQANNTDLQQNTVTTSEPQYDVVWNGTKLGLILAPIQLILFVVLYLYFKNSLSQNGYLIIFIPMVVAAVTAIIFLFIKRNDPHWGGYYIYHMSRGGLVILSIGTLLLLFSYFYSQCSNFSQPFGLSCVRGILDGSLAQKERSTLNIFSR